MADLRVRVTYEEKTAHERLYIFYIYINGPLGPPYIFSVNSSIRNPMKKHRYCSKCGYRVTGYGCLCHKNLKEKVQKPNNQIYKLPIINQQPTGLTREQREKFYQTAEWITLRDMIREVYEKRCMKCGSQRYLHVDHIRPINKYQQRRFDPTNLQILCTYCNKSKSDTIITDYRTQDHIKQLDRCMNTSKQLRHYLLVTKHLQKTRKYEKWEMREQRRLDRPKRTPLAERVNQNAPKTKLIKAKQSDD